MHGSTRLHWKEAANRKGLRGNLKGGNVGTPLRVAGREIQTDGALKLRERSPEGFQDK